MARFVSSGPIVGAGAAVAVPTTRGNAVVKGYPSVRDTKYSAQADFRDQCRIGSGVVCQSGRLRTVYDRKPKCQRTRVTILL